MSGRLNGKTALVHGGTESGEENRFDLNYRKPADAGFFGKELFSLRLSVSAREKFCSRLLEIASSMVPSGMSPRPTQSSTLFSVTSMPLW